MMNRERLQEKDHDYKKIDGGIDVLKNVSILSCQVLEKYTSRKELDVCKPGYSDEDKLCTSCDIQYINMAYTSKYIFYDYKLSQRILSPQWVFKRLIVLMLYFSSFLVQKNVFKLTILIVFPFQICTHLTDGTKQQPHFPPKLIYYKQYSI